MTRSAYDRHVDTVRSCRKCSTVTGPPIIGPSEGARIMLVGQAPGPREGELGRPFGWTAGRTLFQWFDRLGVSEDRFRAKVHISAVIRCFPGRHPAGGDRVPSRAEIDNCYPFLEHEVELLRPQLMIAVGRLSIDQLLVSKRLSEVVGQRHDIDIHDHRLTVVPLPHPSGRSTWTQRPDHRALLDRALELIATHPAWSATFGPGEPSGQ